MRHSEASRAIQAGSGEGKIVALFTTCVAEAHWPGAVPAMVRVLEHFGWTVRTPRGQTCCGRPFLESGYAGEARELAKQMIGLFESVPLIVTPSPGCCATVRYGFRQLLGDDLGWENRCEALAGRTYEFLEFLERVERVDFELLKLPQARRVTWHYSCQLRSLGIRERDSLRPVEQMRNVEFRPLERAEQCCGGGAGFSLRFPEVAEAIIRDKAQCIEASGAALALASEPACAARIARACRDRSAPVVIRHPAELIAEALGLPRG